MNGQADELAMLKLQMSNIERTNKSNYEQLQKDYQLQILRLKDDHQVQIARMKDQLSDMAKQLAEKSDDRGLGAIKVKGLFV